jgi:uncharacterized protein YkwD
VVVAGLLALGILGIAAPALLPSADAAPVDSAVLGDASSWTPPGNPWPDPLPVESPSTEPMTEPGTAPSPTDESSSTEEPRPEPSATVPDEQPDPAASPSPNPRAAQDIAMERRVIELVNERRGTVGCKPVRADVRLARASLGHAQDMARRDYFSHTGRDGSTPWDRAEAAGYQRVTGENLAAGQRSPREVVTAWWRSKGHRANIANCSQKAIGMGVAHGGTYGIYWTQLFGSV